MSKISGKRRSWSGKATRVLGLMVIASMVLAACGQPAAQPTPTTPPAAATPTTAPAPEATPTTAEVATPTATTAAPAAEATPTKPKPVASKEGTLTLWVHSGARPAVEELGKKFTAQTNVPVVVQELGFGDIRDQLKVAGPAGEGPDIIVGAHDWIGELITNGLLEPIDLGAKASNVDPLAIKAFTYQGKLYALPYGLEGIALIYNTELVPTPPKTWDELKQIAKNLQDQKKVDQGYVLQQGDPYHTYPFWTGHGSGVFGRDAQGNYDPKQLLLDNEGGQAAMKELDSMVKAGLLRKDITYDIMTTLFKDGKSAMWFGGPWVLPDLRKSPVANKFGITKIPPMQTESRPFIGSQGFMVSAFGKNKDLAKAFLTDYLATDEAMEIMYKNDPRIPAWKPQRDKVAASSSPEDQQINAFAAAIANGDPMPAIPEMSAVWEAWGKAITLVFQQQEDPVKAIKDAGTTIRAKISGTSH